MIRAGQGTNQDKQRTPEFYQRGGIPIPEEDLYDPVAEYNRGELYADDMLEQYGYSSAFNRGLQLLEEADEKYTDFVQGYFDALEVLAQVEI